MLIPVDSAAPEGDAKRTYKNQRGPEVATISRQIQMSTAALVTAAAVGLTPVLANAHPTLPQAPSLAPIASVLTWGFNELDTAQLALDNDGNPAAAAVPGASAVGASPGQLLQYLVQGIADGIAGIVRGAVVIAGTITYVALAFTGGLITTVGGFLPGPLGDFFVNVGTGFNNVANAVAEALRVGPYATSTV